MRKIPVLEKQIADLQATLNKPAAIDPSRDSRVRAAQSNWTGRRRNSPRPRARGQRHD